MQLGTTQSVDNITNLSPTYFSYRIILTHRGPLFSNLLFHSSRTSPSDTVHFEFALEHIPTRGVTHLSICLHSNLRLQIYTLRNHSHVYIPIHRLGRLFR